jgi:hypothetical protein
MEEKVVSPREQLAGDLKGLQVPDAGEIAQCAVKAGDIEKWTDYFQSLKGWAESPSWRDLAKKEVFSMQCAPEGAPPWLWHLLGGGVKRQGLPALVGLAKKTNGKPMNARQWKEFDEIACGLGQNKLFMAWGNPFPKLADKLLDRSLHDCGSRGSELKPPLGLEIWESPAYRDQLDRCLVADMFNILENTDSFEELQKRCGFLEERGGALMGFGKPVKQRVDLYNECLDALRRNDPKKMKICQEKLREASGKPVFLMRALNEKSEDPDAVSGKNNN